MAWPRSTASQPFLLKLHQAGGTLPIAGIVAAQNDLEPRVGEKAFALVCLLRSRDEVCSHQRPADRYFTRLDRRPTRYVAPRPTP